MSSDFAEMRTTIAAQLKESLAELQSNVAKSTFHCSDIAVRAANRSVVAAAETQKTLEKIDEAMETIIKTLKTSPSIAEPLEHPLISSSEQLNDTIAHEVALALKDTIQEYPLSDATIAAVRKSLRRYDVMPGKYDLRCLRCHSPYTRIYSIGLCCTCERTNNAQITREYVTTLSALAAYVRVALSSVNHIADESIRFRHAARWLRSRVYPLASLQERSRFACIRCKTSIPIKGDFDGLCRDCKHSLSNDWMTPLDERFLYVDESANGRDRAAAAEEFVQGILEESFFGVSQHSAGIFHIDRKVLVMVKNLSGSSVRTSEIKKLQDLAHETGARASVLISLSTPIAKMGRYVIRVVKGRLEVYLTSGDAAEIKAAVRLAYGAEI